MSNRAMGGYFGDSMGAAFPMEWVTATTKRGPAPAPLPAPPPGKAFVAWQPPAVTGTAITTAMEPHYNGRAYLTEAALQEGLRSGHIPPSQMGPLMSQIMGYDNWKKAQAAPVVVTRATPAPVAAPSAPFPYAYVGGGVALLAAGLLAWKLLR